MVSNATFNNISAISCRSVLLVEDIESDNSFCNLLSNVDINPCYIFSKCYF
jgi:hypothetical protein